MQEHVPGQGRELNVEQPLTQTVVRQGCKLGVLGNCTTGGNKCGRLGWAATAPRGLSLPPLPPAERW